jgi:hypothetical protein
VPSAVAYLFLVRSAIEHTIPIRFSLDETFDIGEDTGTPVVDLLETAGELERHLGLVILVIELGKSGLTASDELKLKELNKKAAVAVE